MTSNYMVLSRIVCWISLRYLQSFILVFLGDREKFSLPEDMPVMHFEYTQFYYPGNTEFPCKSKNTF
jgi:hypothetical protein